MKKVVLTGDRPTGKLHLGHYVGSLQNRVYLQDRYEDVFYMIADLQGLTDNAEDPEKIRQNVLEVALDNLAAGVDPSKTTFLIQSHIPEIAELALIFQNLVPLARVQRNPTVKDEMRQKGFDANVPVGFLAYPISQAADILFCKGNVVPVGDDQLPVIEQANEIVHKFNTLYGQVFSEIEALLSATSRLVGTDGEAKASKSLGNAIFLDDSDAAIKEKVMSMYTDPDHVRSSDPGKIDGNVVFTYLDVFHSNKEEVADLKMRYQKGGLGDVEVKELLTHTLRAFIAPIRERRQELSQDTKSVFHILEEGTKKARAVAQTTLNEVREAMHLNYFN